MKKPMIIVAVGLIGLASLSSETRAGDDGAIAAGVIGGLAVGALAGAAIADANRAPAIVHDEEEYVTVYRPRRRIHVYHYDGSPQYVYHHYRYHYDEDSWHDY